jgi:protocatechuate 3,4-dioxygenase beta subunit
MIRRLTSGIIARGLAAAVLTAVLFLASLPAARGQASGANLHGTVTDNTGAVIPNATITVKNVDTGIVNTSRSNSDGVYTVPNLLPGHYQVETNAPAFASSIQTGLILNVGANVALDTQLHVTSTQKMWLSPQPPPRRIVRRRSSLPWSKEERSANFH